METRERAIELVDVLRKRPLMYIITNGDAYMYMWAFAMMAGAAVGKTPLSDFISQPPLRIGSLHNKQFHLADLDIEWFEKLCDAALETFSNKE